MIQYKYIGILLTLLTLSLVAGAQIGGNTSPMQYSTHTYSIVMGEEDNTPLWRIYSGTLSVADVESGSYTPLTRNVDYAVNNDDISGGVAFIEVRFTGAMAPGDYTVAYEETNDDDCFKTEILEIEMQAPFDVDVALLNSADEEDCPDLSGDLQLPGFTDYQTAVAYNVTIENPDPSANDYAGDSWSFRFTVTASGQGGGSSATIDSVEVDYGYDTVVEETLTPGSTVSTYSSVVTVDNDPAVSQVVLTVYFSDALGVTQDIDFELSEIEGSYLELDTDLSELEENVIYAMPDVGDISALN